MRKDIPREDHRTTADRPPLGKLMKKLAPGDVVITSAVDRLLRDTTDLLSPTDG